MRLFIVMLLIVIGSVPVLAGDDSSISLIDTMWVMISAFLVFFMNAGFALVESGFCRTKNSVNILTKNFVVFAIASLAFWAVGYGFMFGKGNSVIGLHSFFVGENSHNPIKNIPVIAFFFFQLAFAAAGCSIVSGAVAERIKFEAYMVFGFFLVAIIYPIGGHWVWGGGWLSKLGFYDFAGSTVVHSVGGWAALSGVIILGPRLGKYREDGSPKAILGHSIPLATLGGFILWFGWFGFNAGSELAFTPNIPRICLTTALGAVTGLLSAMVLIVKLTGKPDLSMIINGSLVGLVAVTAGANVISPVGSLLIGSIAGVLVVLSVITFDKLKLDDPVGALSVHLVGGVWGTIAVGLFAVKEYSGSFAGLFYGGGFSLLITQLIGILSIGGEAFILTFILWKIIDRVMQIRVSRNEEIAGLDVSEMGMEAYNGFQIFTTEN